MKRTRRAEEIVAQCRERWERGESVDPDAEILGHPELADLLRARFGALRLLERAFPPVRRASAPDSMLGRSLGGFRIVSELGSGGMGTVYLATVEDAPGEDGAGGGSVALKVVHPHLLDRPGFLERFLREAEVGKRIRHPNVVSTIDFGVSDGPGPSLHYLVMEYVEGQTLLELLHDLGRVPEALCRHVGREVARALDAIHAAGAVHRDLKPENVLITRDEVVKVMDLGVARLPLDAARLSRTGTFVGSVLYAAPEQFHAGARGLDGRADLYNLGLTLYELATGEHPFAGEDMHEVLRRQVTEKPRPPSERNSQISPFFEEVVTTLLAKDREERFESARILLDTLERGEESHWWHARAVALRARDRRPLRRMRVPRETALYGREPELALLRGLFEKALQAKGQVVLLEGEAGIGKTRLVDEFVAGLAKDGRDFQFLFGSYPPGSASAGAGAFSMAYREHFGVEGLEEALRGHLRATPLLVPAFAALLRGDPPAAAAEPLTKESLPTVFVHATRSLAAERTTVVLVDDLHFASEEGRDLFAALARAVPGHRVLLVGTARPGLPAAWVAGIERLDHASRATLPRLGPKDLARLLVDAFRSERLAEELSLKLATKSDGNPFFVFEIIRGLREGQFLTRKPDGTWIRTAEIRDIQVPSSIMDLIEARVADLEAADRHLLDVASCCGFEFDPALAAAALGMGPIPALQRLATVERKYHLVHSVGLRYVFDHHQVQEALYARLAEPLRREYHAAIAVALEARSGVATADPKSLDGTLCVDLAEHFLKSAKGERGLRYLDAALDYLEKGYVNEAAVRLSDRALAAPGLVLGRARVEMLLRKAARLNVLGRRDTERAALDEALVLADADGDAALRARARVRLGVHLSSIARNDEAMAPLREARDLARAAGDRKTEAAATGNLGNVFRDLGRYAEAQEHYELHLAFSREIGDRRGEAIATGNLGLVFRNLGRYAEAQTQHERNLALSRAIGDRLGEARATGNLGNIFIDLGRYAEAQEHHERHLALSREIGYRRGEARATGNLGAVFDSLGRCAQAQEHYERHVALSREIGDRQGEANSTGGLGGVFLDLGRYAEAQEHYERHLALSRQIGDRQGEAIALANLGPLLDGLGDGPKARVALETSLAICREIGDRRVEGSALLGLGEAVARAGNQGQGLRYIEESLTLRREIRHRHGVADSLLAGGRLRAAMGDAEAARADLAEAATLARDLGLPGIAVLASAHAAALPGGDAAAVLHFFAEGEARLGSHERMEARFIVWRVTHDAEYLAEAKRLLDHLVAHAPEQYRKTMVANVPLHRDIARAAKEAGL